MTPFSMVYDTFFTMVTDDMYMEITQEETERDCRSLLLASLPLFEFPSPIIQYATQTIDYETIDVFTRDLTLEEINILATGMNQLWLSRQINSIELIRQKISGTDFKVSSQASHLNRLNELFIATRDEHRRLQMLYSRRAIKDGEYISTFGMLAEQKPPTRPRNTRTRSE